MTMSSLSLRFLEVIRLDRSAFSSGSEREQKTGSYGYTPRARCQSRRGKSTRTGKNKTTLVYWTFPSAHPSVDCFGSGKVRWKLEAPGRAILLGSLVNELPRRRESLYNSSGSVFWNLSLKVLWQVIRVHTHGV